MTRRILILQYAGDYREAVEKLSRDEEETYRGQKYTVDAVARLTRFGEVATLTLLTGQAYEQRLSNNVIAIGMGLKAHPNDFDNIFEQIERFNPTQIVVRFLSCKILDWISRRGYRTLVMGAEMHTAGSLLRRALQAWRNRAFAKILNRRAIEWVANHHYSASRWLVDIGVDEAKVIPYDYIYLQKPDSFLPKDLPIAGPWRLGYVGQVIESKGIPELLSAVAQLRDGGFPVMLRIIGNGELTEFIRQSEVLGVKDYVEFLNAIPNCKIIETMREMDVVIVPSRHEYSESFGFVVQEAFVSRTPLVTSNHRAFSGRVMHGETGLVFRSGKSRDLVKNLRSLLSDASLYRRLSEAGAVWWEKMQISTKWADIIDHWVSDTDEDHVWLSENTLKSMDAYELGQTSIPRT